MGDSHASAPGADFLDCLVAGVIGIGSRGGSRGVEAGF